MMKSLLRRPRIGRRSVQKTAEPPAAATRRQRTVFRFPNHDPVEAQPGQDGKTEHGAQEKFHRKTDGRENRRIAVDEKRRIAAAGERKKPRPERGSTISCSAAGGGDEDEEEKPDAGVEAVVEGEFLVEEVPSPEVVVAWLAVVPEKMGEGQVDELNEFERPLVGGRPSAARPRSSREGTSWTAAMSEAKTSERIVSSICFRPFAGRWRRPDRRQEKASSG